MFDKLDVISPLTKIAFSSLLVDSYSPLEIVVSFVISSAPLYVTFSLPILLFIWLSLFVELLLNNLSLEYVNAKVSNAKDNKYIIILSPDLNVSFILFLLNPDINKYIINDDVISPSRPSTI